MAHGHSLESGPPKTQDIPPIIMVVEQSLQVYLFFQLRNAGIRLTSKIQEVRHMQIASEIKTKMHKMSL